MSSDGSSDIFGMVAMFIIATAISVLGGMVWLGWWLAGWWGVVTVIAVAIFAVLAFILKRREK